MTEQIPTTSPTQPEEQKLKPQAHRSAAPRPQRPLRFTGRFGEAALRWPDQRAIALSTSVENPEQTHAGSSRDGLRALLAALDESRGHRWSVPAIRRRPVGPRGPGPPEQRLKMGTAMAGRSVGCQKGRQGPAPAPSLFPGPAPRPRILVLARTSSGSG